MKLIAHRGNISGPNPLLENQPQYIMAAIEQGYDVEIDLWKEGPVWTLGHDGPQYQVMFDFLKQPGLWIHCKNYEALQELTSTDLNFFYHTDEDYVLTSRGYIWAYPGKSGGSQTICVMPEYYNTPVDGFDGVCSDYVEKHRD